MTKDLECGDVVEFSCGNDQFTGLITSETEGTWLIDCSDHSMLVQCAKSDKDIKPVSEEAATLFLLRYPG